MRRIIRLGLALTALVAVAGGCKQSSKSLPAIEAPLDLTIPRVESLYIWAHFQPIIRSIGYKEDLRFDEARLVYHHIFWTLIDLHYWWEDTGVGHVWTDAYLARVLSSWTPETQRFQGARERAVAAGLLALSLYLRRPPEIKPDALQLRICYRAKPDPRCKADPRSRALRRMILIAQYADKDLFDTLAAQIKQRPHNRPQASSSEASAPAAASAPQDESDAPETPEEPSAPATVAPEGGL